MLGNILLGSALTALTVSMHAVATAWWIGYLKRIERRVSGEHHPILPFRLLCSTALFLLLLHIAEIVPWAATYRLLPGIESLRTFEESAYFATVTFTSLGYGDIVIQGPWRFLSAIQSMNGLLVFGWSTALLFAVVQRIWGKDEYSRAPDRSQPVPHYVVAARIEGRGKSQLETRAA